MSVVRYELFSLMHNTTFCLHKASRYIWQFLKITSSLSVDFLFASVSYVTWPRTKYCNAQDNASDCMQWIIKVLRFSKALVESFVNRSKIYDENLIMKKVSKIIRVSASALVYWLAYINHSRRNNWTFHCLRMFIFCLPIYISWLYHHRNSHICHSRDINLKKWLQWSIVT